MKKEISLAQFNKMKPIRYRSRFYESWKEHGDYRLVRRNKVWARIAFIIDGKVLTLLYHNNDVELKATGK